MEIGQKIRRLREKHSLKQINLANALQVSPQAVSKWERGAAHPDIPVLMKMAALFDVTTDYLLGTTAAGSNVFPATVFCSGLAHFARRAIAMDSREVADYTNVLFYHLTESVLKYDGIPVKYVGAGFLCFFSGVGHADRAIDAAVHAKKVIYQKELIIALNAGDIYMGLVGHPQYATRDIVGDTVNRAFLILESVSRCCPSGVGATDNVISLAHKAFTTTRHAGVEVGLLDTAVDIHEIHIP
jgi:transcriptional regulator with XRE-family HTH domain